MRITNELREYLRECIDAMKSEILIADLDKVIYSANLSAESMYLNEPLSKKLKEIVASWQEQSQENELFISEPLSCIDIISNDSYKYTSQIFLPIYHDNKLDGIFIHFTDNRTYICSNLRNAKTLRHFTEILSSEEFIKKNS